MRDHGKKWHQRVYLTSTWGCAVCDQGNAVYQSPEALHAHISELHPNTFPPESLDVISRQSKMERPRASNECLLCCFTIENVKPETMTVLPKRQKPQVEHERRKSARTTTSMRHPATEKIVDDADLEESDRFLAATGGDQDLAKTETTARHIASHLQTLMLLLMRVSSLQHEQPDDGDDSKSVSVDIGDSDGMFILSQRDTPGGSQVDGSTEMQDIEPLGGEDVVGSHLADMFYSDEMPVPDTDMDITSLGVENEFDHLSPEQDAFLQTIIHSGAFRAFQEDVPPQTGDTSSDSESDSDVDTDKLSYRMLELFVLSEFDGEGRRFLPITSLNNLVSKRVIIKELESRDGKGKRDLDQIAQFILKHAYAKKFFAIIVSPGFRWPYLMMKNLMDRAKDLGLDDRCLPIDHPSSPDESLSHTLRLSSLGKLWNTSSILRFYKEQWLFLVPVFEVATTENHEAYQDFKAHCIMPFIKRFDDDRNTSMDGFGSVTKWEIHPDHLKDPAHPVGQNSVTTSRRMVTLEWLLTLCRGNLGQGMWVSRKYPTGMPSTGKEKQLYRGRSTFFGMSTLSDSLLPFDAAAEATRDTFSCSSGLTAEICATCGERTTATSYPQAWYAPQSPNLKVSLLPFKRCTTLGRALHSATGTSSQKTFFGSSRTLTHTKMTSAPSRSAIGDSQGSRMPRLCYPAMSLLQRMGPGDTNLPKRKPDLMLDFMCVKEFLGSLTSGQWDVSHLSFSSGSCTESRSSGDSTNPFKRGLLGSISPFTKLKNRNLAQPWHRSTTWRSPGWTIWHKIQFADQDQPPWEVFLKSSKITCW